LSGPGRCRSVREALRHHPTGLQTGCPLRARLYRENLGEILYRRQINVVSAMLRQWCTNVLRSKVEPMKHQLVDLVV